MLAGRSFQGYRYGVQKKNQAKDSPLIRMSRRGRNAFLLSLLAAATVVGTACTSSAPEGVAPWSFPTGTGSVARAVIGVPVDAALPEGFMDELSDATALTLTQVAVDLGPGGTEVETATEDEPDEVQLASVEAVDVLMGYDPDWFAPALAGTTNAEGDVLDLVDLSSVTYGTDNACVLADASWFSANNLPLPAKVSELPTGALEQVVATSDPRISPYALAALPEWDDLWGTWQKARSEETAQSGGEESEEDGGGKASAAGAVGPQSGEEDGGEGVAPGKVGSALEPIRNPNNLGTDTRYRVLSDTCVERKSALIDLSVLHGRDQDDAAYVILADYLAGSAGAELLAKYGVAAPAQAGAVQSDEPPAPEVRAAYSVQERVAALRQWEKTFA